MTCGIKFVKVIAVYRAEKGRCWGMRLSDRDMAKAVRAFAGIGLRICDRCQSIYGSYGDRTPQNRESL